MGWRAPRGQLTVREAHSRGPASRPHEAARKSLEGTLRFREGGTGLNRRLSILRTLIFDSRVEAGMASLVAAPNGPDTRPLASSRAASINERSCSTSVLPLEAAGTGLG